MAILGGILHERHDTGGHEAAGVHGLTASGHFRDVDDGPAGGNLDPAAGSSRGDLIEPHGAARIDAISTRSPLMPSPAARRRDS
ncbi:MAG: hypothetical protein ABR532_07205 [Candidatus Dormibacteria bacterium]